MNIGNQNQKSPKILLFSNRGKESGRKKKNEETFKWNKVQNKESVGENEKQLAKIGNICSYVK